MLHVLLIEHPTNVGELVGWHLTAVTPTTNTTTTTTTTTRERTPPIRESDMFHPKCSLGNAASHLETTFNDGLTIFGYEFVAFYRAL